MLITFKNKKRTQLSLRLLSKQLKTNTRITILYKALDILIDIKLLISSTNQFVVFRSF